MFFTSVYVKLKGEGEIVACMSMINESFNDYNV